jgi:hypothetical protein
MAKEESIEDYKKRVGPYYERGMLNGFTLICHETEEYGECGKRLTNLSVQQLQKLADDGCTKCGGSEIAMRAENILDALEEYNSL